MITEDEIRNQKIWDEVMENINIRTEIMPYERTKAQLKREYGFGREQIDKIIDDLFRNGVIKKRPALDRGKACIAYSFVSGLDFSISP